MLPRLHVGGKGIIELITKPAGFANFNFSAVVNMPLVTVLDPSYLKWGVAPWTPSEFVVAATGPGLPSTSRAGVATESILARNNLKFKFSAEIAIDSPTVTSWCHDDGHAFQATSTILRTPGNSPPGDHHGPRVVRCPKRAKNMAVLPP